MRYFIRLSYRGTKYKGWQIQPKDLTVQETIEKGLSKILRTPIEITGCGRTDAGVHAKDYVAHFDALLLGYDHFFPFCKTNTEVKTMHCKMYRSEWLIDQDAGRMVFHIAANRFLRGMVRLIVGMCLNVAIGKITLDAVRDAMEKQVRLSKSLSVPPDGLYLVDIRYPYAF